MMVIKISQVVLWLVVSVLIMGCSFDPTLTPTLPQPTADPYFAAQGGGEPRSAAYWQLWNSCAPDNKSETAAANGGRAAGWFIMDDLLEDPGVLAGTLEVISCVDGLRLLDGQAISGATNPEDVAYPLAAQLLTAQLNLGAAAEYCPASDDAVRSSQLLLIGAGFNGVGAALDGVASAQDRELARQLTGILADYNAGSLCQ